MAWRTLDRIVAIINVVTMGSLSKINRIIWASQNWKREMNRFLYGEIIFTLAIPDVRKIQGQESLFNITDGSSRSQKFKYHTLPYFFLWWTMEEEMVSGIIRGRTIWQRKESRVSGIIRCKKQWRGIHPVMSLYYIKLRWIEVSDNGQKNCYWVAVSTLMTIIFDIV